ncbi:MAG: hypothetical protein EXS31_06520 [Pedosphaera sp.]|nr:hypothetical protein [Pedosphaera sp.]
MEMYTSDNNEKFPFSPEGHPRVFLISVWTMIHPYVNTNGSFFLCPADRGPMNFLVVKATPSYGIKTNALPFPESYLYYASFYSDWDKNGSSTPRQRYTSEVKYPSQKVIFDCQASDNPKQIGNSKFDGQAHGKERTPILFVDGHSSNPPWRKWGPPDPSVPAGTGYILSRLDWINIP